MKNKSEMNSLRYIVHRSFDQLFDTSHMWKTHFKTMSFDSFRKYVSRLVEEKELIPVGKGLYYRASFYEWLFNIIYAKINT